MAAFEPAPKTASARARLAAFPFVQGMEKSAFARIADAAELRHFPEDELLVAQNEFCPSVPFVERGRIRVQQEGEAGLRYYDVGPGETCVLALSCTLAMSPAGVSALVIAGTDAVMLPGDAIRRAFEADPVLQRYVLGVFAHRLEDLMQLASSATSETVADRLMDLLQREASEGVVRLTHAEIATMLGTAREVVSRTLDRLREDGKVELGRRRVTLL